MGWSSLPDWEPPFHTEPCTPISIIIPARNEEENIAACLQALSKQQYPQHLLQITVVDDHSNDQTPNIIGRYAAQMPNLQCLRLADALPTNTPINSYKKKALEYAIANSTGELIVATDADCVAPPTWLLALATYYEKHRPEMMAAPVAFSSIKGFYPLFNASILRA